jgi:hypothetical protein
MADLLQRIWEWLNFERVKWITLLFILALLALVIWQNGLKDIFTEDGSSSLLTKLSQVDFGRFMITCLIVLIVIIIAGNMTYALFNPKSDPNFPLDKRFSLGRELLTVFIGLLGTLMGFYFAENRVSPDNVQKIANTVQNQPPPVSSQLESRAFEYLIKQDYDEAVKAFDSLTKATPPSSNIANITAITKYLTDKDNRVSFTASGDKKDAWQKLYCLISEGKMAVGMSKEINDQFDSGCRPPLPANTNTSLSATPRQPANTIAPANATANIANKTNKVQ